MKHRVIAYILASLMLISSGAVQVAMHVCPEEGINILSDCGMHDHVASAKKACCKPVKLPDAEANCCQDAFLFAISPKFGAIEKAELAVPVCFIETAHIAVPQWLSLIPAAPGTLQDQAPPPLFNRQILQHYCRLVI